MSNRSNYLLLACVVGSFLAAWVLCLVAPGVFDIWNLHANDALFRLRYRLFGARPVYPHVSHLDIDDSSMPRLDYSSRDERLYANALRVLTRLETAATAVDILFAVSGDDERARQLTAATRESGRTYFPVILAETPAAGAGARPPALAAHAWRIEVTRPGDPPVARRAFLSYPELVGAARGIGHITCHPDEDGTYRRLPLLIRCADGFVPSLALRVACDYLQVPPGRIRVAFGQAITLDDARFPDGRRKTITIPVDSQGRIIVNFSGPWADSFPHYSIADLQEAAKDEKRLTALRDEMEGNIVVLSDVSTGGRDIGSVPFESIYPLSGLHANVISSILKEDFVRELPFGGKLAIDLALVALLCGSALRLRASGLAVAALLLIVLFAGFALALFLAWNTQTNVVRPAFGIALALISVSMYEYVVEERRETFLRAQMQQYFRPALLEKILKAPETLETRDKKVLTLLFSDISGFTAWSATRDPEEIRRTLNEYFDAMADIVFHYGGTIDKYMGDGLLVFFGDPEEQPDHALRGVQAAIGMQEKVRALRERWAREKEFPIQIRIGVHSGEVVVGNMGSEKRFDYTVIGSDVNLAQRLESSDRVGGILISKAVYEQVKGSVDARSLGRIFPKGFPDGVDVYEIVLAEES
ncbi:MAG: adenylate/guanylate cyclase domain-containing protein [Kiritimatiellae bacterium]|nr:adenylate/guanylate cyclase domain-containing protein [Kiritimatiellia bacterium]